MTQAAPKAAASAQPMFAQASNLSLLILLVLMVVVYSLIVMVILIPLALELGKRAKNA